MLVGEGRWQLRLFVSDDRHGVPLASTRPAEITASDAPGPLTVSATAEDVAAAIDRLRAIPRPR